MGQVRQVVEEILVQQMHPPVVLTGVTATFGQSVDVTGYDSAMIELNVGTFSAPVTLSAILYEDSKDQGDTAKVPVTLANLGVITGAGVNTLKVGGIASRNYKRYLSLRLQAGQSNGANPTIGISANMLLGKANKEKVPNSPSFSLVDDGKNVA
jgi:hypothetical protein